MSIIPSALRTPKRHHPETGGPSVSDITDRLRAERELTAYAAELKADEANGPVLAVAQ